VRGHSVPVNTLVDVDGGFFGVLRSDEAKVLLHQLLPQLAVCGHCSQRRAHLQHTKNKKKRKKILVRIILLFIHEMIVIMPGIIITK
jgi:hypothetical protein